MSSPERLLLEPGNPHDFENLEELAAELGAEGLDAQVVRRDETGYGTTFFEVLRIWLYIVEGVRAANDTHKVTSHVVRWLRDRWQADLERTGKPRPRTFTLYNQFDEPTYSVMIDLPDSEPAEQEINEDARVFVRPQAPDREDHGKDR
jgi:hypothetical protein